MLFYFKIVVAFLLLVNATLVYSANTKSVILVTSKAGGAYQTFVDSFSEEYFSRVGTASSSEIKVMSMNQLSLDKKDLKSKGSIVVTVGTKAATFLAGLDLKLPVIHAMLPFSAYKKIQDDSKSCAIQSAVYIDQPIKRQIALSEIIFPGRARYGFILGNVSSKRYEVEKEMYRFPTSDIATKFIEDSRELAWTLRDLSENVDVLIALNDPLVFNPNNAKWLLYMAYQENMPLIGFSKPYVSAGASAAVYSTPGQLGKQTADLVVKQQKSKSGCLFMAQYPRDFSIAINKAVVESLSGRVLSEDVVHEYLLKKEKLNK